MIGVPSIFKLIREAAVCEGPADFCFQVRRERYAAEVEKSIKESELDCGT